MQRICLLPTTYMSLLCDQNICYVHMLINQSCNVNEKIKLQIQEDINVQLVVQCIVVDLLKQIVTTDL